ncbi:hypothetical protein JXX30_15870 [Rhodococcus erythropolis]|uniref:hypothetical protein n=1 Tax=Rhodococcus erythropolis TaxID=1833 RepID=UPI0019824478|nr:hypothetical protein [Rhodococcus erythropolis]QSE38894.1 hypothetical protein JXX30_15870 [Rhodococcus erythropolis]
MTEDLLSETEGAPEPSLSPLAVRAQAAFKQLEDALAELENWRVPQLLRDIMFVTREVLYSTDTIFDRTLRTTVKVRMLDYVSEQHVDELALFLPIKIPDIESGNLSELVAFLANWTDRAVTSAINALRSGDWDELNTGSENATISKWERLQKDLVGKKSFRQIGLADDFEEIAKRAIQHANEAEQARDNALRASGDTGTIELSSHFSALATTEDNSAGNWTKFALAALVAAFITGLVVLLLAADRGWPSILSHLALALPILAIAAYAARVASHHRDSALWAKSTAVQLKTVRAYADSFATDQAREQILLTLGTRAFSAPDFGIGGKTDAVTVLPPDLVDVLKSAVQAVKRE